MLNLVTEGEEDYIEAIRYRRRLKLFENFLFLFVSVTWPRHPVYARSIQAYSNTRLNGVTQRK